MRCCGGGAMQSLPVCLPEHPFVPPSFSCKSFPSNEACLGCNVIPSVCCEAHDGCLPECCTIKSVYLPVLPTGVHARRACWCSVQCKCTCTCKCLVVLPDRCRCPSALWMVATTRGHTRTRRPSSAWWVGGSPAIVTGIRVLSLVIK
jgi:hypothetical protein